MTRTPSSPRKARSCTTLRTALCRSQWTRTTGKQWLAPISTHVRASCILRRAPLWRARTSIGRTARRRGLTRLRGQVRACSVSSAPQRFRNRLTRRFNYARAGGSPSYVLKQKYNRQHYLKSTKWKRLLESPASLPASAKYCPFEWKYGNSYEIGRKCLILPSAELMESIKATT